MRFRIVSTLVAALIALLMLSGCGQTREPNAAQESANATATVETMPIDDKQSLIATNFPIEVPVPAGTVTRGKAQGTDAWDYELLVDAPLDAVESWYEQAYSGRSWELAQRTEDGDRVALTFVKGAAQSRVELSESAGSTKAAVVLGVGAPVLQTQ